MNSVIMKLVFFSILINFAVSIMITAVPAFDGLDTKLGMDADETASQTYSDTEILDEFGNPINANPTGEDSAQVNSNTLMDRTILGGINNIKNVIDKYMFGFVNLLNHMFSPHVPQMVFGLFKIIIGMLYSITIFELISGRRILGD